MPVSTRSKRKLRSPQLRSPQRRRSRSPQRPIPSTIVNRKYNIRQINAPAKEDKYCVPYLGGFIKLDGTFLENEDLIIFYELNTDVDSIKFNEIPDGQYFFVIGYDTKISNLRLGLIGVNPSEFYSYHYSLLTLMIKKNPNLNMVMSGEFRKDDNNTLSYSDESGTYLYANYKELIKYIGGDTNYKQWVNENISPMFTKLTGAKHIEFIPNGGGKSKLVNNTTKNVLNSFALRCRLKDKKKLVYVSSRDCMFKQNSIGNICDDSEDLRKKIEDHKRLIKERGDEIPPELRAKWDNNNQDDLTDNDLLTLFNILKVPVIPIGPTTRKLIIRRLAKYIDK